MGRGTVGLERLLDHHGPNLPLGEAALTLAQEERPDLPVERYLEQLDAWAERVDRQAGAGSDVVETLHRVLFEDLAFDGNREDYYRPENSLLHRVMESRTGLPLTLSIVYVEVARRVGLKADGIAFPAHFLVRLDEGGQPAFIDPFHRGQRFRASEMEGLLHRVLGTEAPLEPWMLSPPSHAQVLTRLLSNLKFAYSRQDQTAELVTVLDRMLVLEPGDGELLKERGLGYARLGLYPAAARDLEDALDKVNALERARLQALIPRLRASSRSLN